MINPRDMYDHDIIAEYQGWLIAATNLDGASFSPGTPLGNRWNDIRREFNKRMGFLAGTKEEIDAERERMQEVVGRLPGPRLEF